MVATPQGGIAFTTPNDLGLIEGDRFSVHKLAWMRGGAEVIAGVRDIYLSNKNGLLRIRNGQIATLDARRFPWASVRTLVQAPTGETWLIRRTEISRMATADLDRAFADPDARISRRIFNSHDGLLSIVQHSGFSGTQAAVGGDGRLWFLNREGASFIDPAALATNRLPPPVTIRALAAGGRTYVDPHDLALPAGTHALDISYAGLSLAVPARVRFRYRLDGVDDDWVDPGTRRLAGYSNLTPGRYVFRVLAANNDGVWSATPATLAFTIPPTFLQSIWFRLLCGLVLMLLVTLAYRLRLRQVTARLQSRFDARITERERIARELHDTLLQGIQGLMLRFQAVTNRVPAQAGLRNELENALEQAETVLVDGRRRVRDLRRPSQERDLANALRDACAAAGKPVDVTVEGSARPLHPLVREEALAIGEEALRNAFQHARAGHIGVTVHYGARAFVLAVEDDGVGLPDAVTAQGGRDGHFGLVGMRERAARIDGRLAVTRGPDGGTRVVLALSARAAYARRAWHWFGG